MEDGPSKPDTGYLSRCLVRTPVTNPILGNTSRPRKDSVQLS